MLRARGHQVEVQNYIDNTGVQVADVVAGFHYLAHLTPAAVRGLIADPVVRFDYYCWDLYARTSAWYHDHPEDLSWRSKTLHAIESGEGELFELAHLVADAIVEKHLATMLRLDVEYDVLPRESEILHLEFWSAAFALLKERGAIFFETEGKHAGCWVMPGLSEEGKVTVRSDGTVVYTGKDIAYQLWKFGLLGKDFYYRPMHTYADGRTLWVTTSEPSESGVQFGHGARVYNVRSTSRCRRDICRTVARRGRAGWGTLSRPSDRFISRTKWWRSRRAVAPSWGYRFPRKTASVRSVESFGARRAQKAGRPAGQPDFASALGASAPSRHPENSAEENRAVATGIAVGALRYFLLKFTRNTVIAFDLQEAAELLEGETWHLTCNTRWCGRARFPVAASRIDRARRCRILPLRASTAEAMGRQLQSEDFWQVLLAASKAESALESAVNAGEPAHVARYAFQLAQAFSNFYQKYPVIHEENREKKVFLLWMTSFFQRQLEWTAAILGIPLPAYM